MYIYRERERERKLWKLCQRGERDVQFCKPSTIFGTTAVILAIQVLIPGKASLLRNLG